VLVRHKDEESILKITIKHSQTEMGLVFHCRTGVLLFLLVATFLMITFLFFSFFAYTYTDPTHFAKFSSLMVFSLRKTHRMAFQYFTHSRGSNEKINERDSGIPTLQM